MMRLMLFLLVAFATGPLLAQQCKWDPGPPIIGTGGGTIDDSACFDVSPLSVIHLESDGCVCLADLRIVGTFQSCGSVATTIGAPGGCETYSFDLNITAVASSLGNFMGSHISGTSTGQTPPVFYVDAQVVPCNDVFVFAMNSSCTCFRQDTSRSIGSRPSFPGPSTMTGDQMIASATPQVVQYTSTTTVVVCTSGAPNAEFSAYCVNDCDPSDPPDPVIVEGQ